MEVFKTIKNKFIGLNHTINRYPLAMMILLATAAVNAYMIGPETETYLPYPYTLVVGAAFSIIAQLVYERFFTRLSERNMLQAGAVLLMLGYYFLIANAQYFDVEGTTKTSVLLFALAIVFMWVPSIKNSVTFNQTFLAAFKGFFTTVLFTGVITLGVASILLAVDQLLFTFDSLVYTQIYNIIFTLFAPVFFLSLIPIYPGKKGSTTSEQTADIEKSTACPKTLDILLSYVIIPLTGIYTLVLLAYILINIQSEFWQNDLLESLLVSYAIIVILVYILASNLTNRFAAVFRSIFPVALIPIAFFQTVASVLKIGDMGMTPGRYYVIIFGAFAVISGLIFLFFATRKNGWAAIILFVCAIVSIIPPADAFTVTRTSQASILKDTLKQHNMLENGTVQPDADIPTRDKRTISQTVSYLENMGYTDDVDWLPEDVGYDHTFEETFGFEKEGEDTENNASAHFSWRQNPVVDIAGYDRMLHPDIKTTGLLGTKDMKIDATHYQLKSDSEDGNMLLKLKNDNHTVLTFDLSKAYGKILESGKEDINLSPEEATVTESNDAAQLTLMAGSINYYNTQFSGDVYVFIDIK